MQAIASLHNLLGECSLSTNVCPALPRPGLWAGQGGAGRGREAQQVVLAGAHKCT